jgi:hypothetical protein
MADPSTMTPEPTITLSRTEARALIESAITSFSHGPFSYFETIEGHTAGVAEAVDAAVTKLFPSAKKPSDVLGWMDSEGPVTRAPGKPT